MSWPRFRALCRIVVGQDELALAAELGNPQAWPTLLELARQQQVVAALAGRVAVTPAQIPPAVAQALAQARLDNVRRNMKIAAQALKLAHSLNSAGIEPLFLKGTAQLLCSEQGDYGFRQQLDIDLLLRPDELEPACDVLLRDGYAFCRAQDPGSGQPLLTRDKSQARLLSRAHHHLLPLVKQGYPAMVELHRHHLPRRFQATSPTALMFASATGCERNGIRFLVPCASQQIIHVILGCFVHDGYARRFDFPIRSACDYEQFVARAAAPGAGGSSVAGIDVGLIERQCGKYLALFNQLVIDVAAGSGMQALSAPVDTRAWVKLLQARYRWPISGAMLDAQGRVRHLAASAVYSPGKLPAYLKKLVRAPWQRR